MNYSDTLRDLSKVLSEVPNESIRIVLNEAAEKIDMFNEMINRNRLAVEQIKFAVRINNRNQDKATNPVGMQQSIQWHSYETIDDHLFEALNLLGD